MIGTHIYCVYHENGDVKYVGRTTYTIRGRLNCHSSAKTALGNWIRENREHVRVRELDCVSDRQASHAERAWINHYRGKGHVLFNRWPVQRKLEGAMSGLDAAESTYQIKGETA